MHLYSRLWLFSLRTKYEFCSSSSPFLSGETVVWWLIGPCAWTRSPPSAPSCFLLRSESFSRYVNFHCVLLRHVRDGATHVARSGRDGARVAEALFPGFDVAGEAAEVVRVAGDAEDEVVPAVAAGRGHAV